MKIKRLKRSYLVGLNVFHHKRFNNERAKKQPSSVFGDSLHNLRLLKLNYHDLRTYYIKNVYVRLKKNGSLGLQERMVEFLESRLDTLVFRSGMSRSFAHASQMIAHKKVTVNGRVCQSRSMIIRSEDKVSINCSSIQHDPKVSVAWIRVLSNNSFVFKGNIEADGVPYVGNINFNSVFRSL